MNRFVCVLLLMVGFMCSALKAQALESPLGISFFPPIEFPLPSGTVKGFRFNLMRGVHESVYGLDFGCMFNQTTKNFAGTQIGLLHNGNTGRTSIFGLQFAMIGNYNFGPTDMVGLQVSLTGNINSGKGTMVGAGVSLLGNFTRGTFIGAQIAAFNEAQDLYGVQLGLGNSSEPFYGAKGQKSTAVGIQVGAYNQADSIYGFQIGIVNYAESLHGIQIGLININKTGWLPVFPVINAGF